MTSVDPRCGTEADRWEQRNPKPRHKLSKRHCRSILDTSLASSHTRFTTWRSYRPPEVEPQSCSPGETKSDVSPGLPKLVGCSCGRYSPVAISKVGETSGPTRRRRMVTDYAGLERC
jgi:hypothetical protein